MIPLPPATHCRLSGEPLTDAPVLLDVPACPLPGVYPEGVEESVRLRVPLRVVQAARSGLVQLGHVLDAALYARYAFAGGTAKGYRSHLAWFARQLADRWSPSVRLLEIGCGDGTLLRGLQEAGFGDLLGIDPGLAVPEVAAGLRLVHGYFPRDLAAADRAQPFEVIVLRHVLEHIETPRAFVADLAAALAEAGEVWIEVPDLEATLRHELWSNFYPLHCTYYDAGTLDALMAAAGFRVVAGAVVDVFGGSILRRYARTEWAVARVTGEGGSAATGPLRQPPFASRMTPWLECVRGLVRSAPVDTLGYGAAERTAVTLGLCPELEGGLRGLVDGNPHLHGRHLAGTRLRIGSKAELVQRPPAAIVLLAVSHTREILAEFRATLPPATRVGIVGAAGGFRPLSSFDPHELRRVCA